MTEAPADPEPARPRLARHAVVLRRATSELQVGTGPAVLVPTSYARLLALLSDGRTAPDGEEVAAAVGLDTHDVATTLVELGAAGLLDRRAPQVPGAVRVVGAGPLADAVSDLLAAGGVRRLYLAAFDHERFETDRRAGLRGRHPDLEAATVRHWTKPEQAAVHLTVLAGAGPEVDRLVADHLVGTGQPHLVLRSAGVEASVGPFVLPGRTSCLRCCDLSRADADAGWPYVLGQLAQLRVDPEPLLLAWAAATAAQEALAFLQGAQPTSAGTTLELATRDHRVRRRDWRPHPRCGCGWSSQGEWAS